jgi:hypothetical protein
MDTAPVDKAMRLPGHGYTARVEQMVADLGADEVSEKVFKRLERLTRIRLSAKDS